MRGYRRFVQRNLLVEITSNAQAARLLSWALRKHTFISYALYTAGALRHHDSVTFVLYMACQLRVFAYRCTPNSTRTSEKALSRPIVCQGLGQGLGGSRIVPANRLLVWCFIVKYGATYATSPLSVIWKASQMLERHVQALYTLCCG